ncbi:MAG TPA: hypothetical protein VHU83_10165 [Bryobacteraceae bacterium]|jgi:hypothetical protein|nr:hypothetical protein [Bryobacteraceae bacterium]
METKTKSGIALGLFSAATIAGFIVGRSTSWHSENPDTAYVYLARHGRWTKIDQSRGRVELPAGTRLYTYTTGENAVQARFIPVDQIANYREPIDLDSDSKDLMSIAVAPPVEGGVVASMYFAAVFGATLHAVRNSRTSIGVHCSTRTYPFDSECDFRPFKTNRFLRKVFSADTSSRSRMNADTARSIVIFGEL